MQKLLLEEFPKNCKEENRFIRISKYEYSFGEEKIKVSYEDNDVVLKLDEGDYKLSEFIEILNEGKEEENENENENENDNEENNDEEENNEVDNNNNNLEEENNEADNNNNLEEENNASGNPFCRLEDKRKKSNRALNP